MKTLKLIFAALLVAATMYSCSSDRDNESSNQNETPKVNFKKLKTNNNQRETSKAGDTINVAQPQRFDPVTGEEISNDQELIPPGDVKPPKGGK
ncbi:hypothetical protein CEY12_05975 [Chryseobacterium sp. T16E-39]|uniref:hypothetical protein n=1 Tax=Chryseobacterium sp. T16E-39 TaxID=2015076 RepID=UPI000B5B199F|nr:hypothetical protein [Chryseobacterium sp. T16E-39]ASK29678.1 hypothetical protein CEY12_05975 [Chryseobacterium sp. T16E-39]